MDLFFEILSLWAGVKLSGWAQVNNNSTLVEEKSHSNIPSQTRCSAFPCASPAEYIASQQKCSQCSNSYCLFEEGSKSFVRTRELEQEITGYGYLSLPRDIETGEVQGVPKSGYTSASASPLCKCFGSHIKRFSVKLEVGVLDKDATAIVNSYFMCGNWAVVLEGFDDKGVWNLIVHNSITGSFNLKAQNEKIVKVSQWIESEELSPKTIWNSWINEMSLILSSEVRDLLYVYGIHCRYTETNNMTCSKYKADILRIHCSKGSNISWLTL
jgi:hypothetical protein